jgi:hypothetical protein
VDIDHQSQQRDVNFPFGAQVLQFGTNDFIDHEHAHYIYLRCKKGIIPYGMMRFWCEL